MRPLRLRAALSAYKRDQRGNFALMTMLMLTILVGFGGAGMDYSRAQLGKQQLQFAVDSGGLAVGQIFRSYDDPKAAVRDFVEANLQGTHIDMDTLEVNTVIEETPTSREVNIDAKAEVKTLFSQLLGYDKYVISAETSTFEAYQDLEVALVLDISSSMGGSKISELRDAAKVFVDTLLEDEKDREYRRISIVPYGGTVKLGDDFFDYLAPGYDRDKWNGCLDFDSSIMDDGLIDLATYDPVPHMWYWNRPNPWCPKGTSEPIFFSNDADELKTYIDGLTQLSDGTGSDIGSAWGLKALSPQWAGRLAGAPAGIPAAYGDAVKALVIMTDGGITMQYRKNGYDLAAAFGDDDLDEDDDHPNADPVKGDYQKYNKTQARANFTAVCDTAQSREGIQVYTVGFQVRQTWMLDLLKDCASNVNNYSTANSGELEAVFEAIALRLDPLKLVN